jgi:hypothetical protein
MDEYKHVSTSVHDVAYIAKPLTWYRLPLIENRTNSHKYTYFTTETCHIFLMPAEFWVLSFEAEGRG